MKLILEYIASWRLASEVSMSSALQRRRRPSQVAVTLLVFCLSQAQLAQASSSHAQPQPQQSPTLLASSAESNQQQHLSKPVTDQAMPVPGSSLAFAIAEQAANVSSTTSTASKPVTLEPALQISISISSTATATTTTAQPTDTQHTTTQQRQYTTIGGAETQQQAIISLQMPQPQQPHCALGDDTFHIGERWNPNLPPFGIQVCVLCECTVRSRKNCYETKVTCRRITNECPIIDSCADGTKPTTQPGQCCKSCQSPASLPAYESGSAPGSQPNQTTAFKIVYMNERTKDYLSMVNNLPACSALTEAQAASGSASGGGQPSSATVAGSAAPPAATVVVGGGAVGSAQSAAAAAGAATSTGGSASTQSPPTQLAKSAKSGRNNDLNGIDTRLAFKSLHDSVPHLFNSISQRANDNTKSSEQANSAPPPKRRIGGSAGAAAAAAASAGAAQSEADHQHPNDVQLATQLPQTGLGKPQSNQYSQAGVSRQQQPVPTSTSCLLGNETFQVGDVWRPILPPHGVQVCVQCNCIFRVRRGCFETKITCRRTHRDCPVIDVCPDGQAPVVVDGQCCKSCPSPVAPAAAIYPATSSNVMIEQQHMLNSLPTPETIQRNEKVYREFQNLMKNMNACVKNRESIDIYQTNRYAKRSHTTVSNSNSNQNNNPNAHHCNDCHKQQQQKA